jgi:HEAT repeat protein
LSQWVSRLLAEGNVRGLCRLLRARDPMVRSRAAQALEKLAEPSAVPCLAKALKRETDPHTQQHAISALGAIGGREATEALAHLLYSGDRLTARLAEQALRAFDTPEAGAALAVRSALARSDWDALAALGEEESWALEPVLGSGQFLMWVPGKQQRVLETAITLGLTPPRSLAPRLKAMGVFLGKVHTLGDVLDGLRDPDQEVRVAAINTLAKNKDRWVGSVLRGCFRREAHRGSMAAAVAAARALAQLGDLRGIDYYRKRLYEGNDIQAAEALGKIGIREATLALFDFLVRASASSVPSSRPLSAAWLALGAGGPQIVEHLRPLLESPNPNVRRLLAGAIARSGHPETIALLSRLARDENGAVQRGAVEALGNQNSPDAADALHQLADSAPRDILVKALRNITHPEAAAGLRALGQIVTELVGVLATAEGNPVPEGRVQALREHYLGEVQGWEWRPVGRSALTEADGSFYLLLPDDLEELHLKVTQPGKEESLTAPISLQKNCVNRVRVQVDHLLRRLLIVPD